jgi:hypothetical protein
MDAHPDQQLVDIDRLAQIIHAADLEPLDHVLAFRKARHEHYRHLREFRAGLDPRRCLETVDPGHDGVHQDKIRHDMLQQIESGRSGDCNKHGYTSAFESIRQKAQRIRLVVNHQNRIAPCVSATHREDPPEFAPLRPGRSGQGT